MDTTSLPPDDRPPVASPRRRNRGLLWAAALASVVLAIATVVAFTSSDGGSGTQKLDQNATVPSGVAGDTDVSGQEVPGITYTTFDDQDVRLATDGRPMVVNFWASYCGPCISEMPAIEAVYRANQGRVDFLGLDVTEAAESGRDMIARTAITYPVGRDARGSIFEAFGGLNLPRTALVAADGTIVAVHTGSLDQAGLQALIDEHFGG
jgi:thiol-disulfide isomerase/thioredoxin